jgi:hypothetical protein
MIVTIQSAQKSSVSLPLLERMAVTYTKLSSCELSRQTKVKYFVLNKCRLHFRKERCFRTVRSGQRDSSNHGYQRCISDKTEGRGFASRRRPSRCTSAKYERHRVQNYARYLRVTDFVNFFIYGTGAIAYHVVTTSNTTQSSLWEHLSQHTRILERRTVLVMR